MERRPGTSGRVAAGVVAVIGALLMGGAVLAQGGGASPEPAAPAASGDVLPGEPNPPWEDGALPASVHPDLVNVRPQRWDHVLVGPDGRTVNVYFTSGHPDCVGLADVRVTQGTGPAGIVLWVGDVPNAPACAEIAQLYRVVVVMDERLLRGGELLDLPAG
jgi:hypothetical protein